MAVTPDLNQIAVVMSQLQQNYSQLAQNWFDIFYNTTPQDITVKFFDELGNLETYTVPNRAKDFNNIKNGEGTPEGSVTATKGVIYQDLTNGEAYIKTTATGNTNWQKFVTQNQLDHLITKKAGSPEGVESGTTGDLYVNTDNGDLYVKTTATGNTDWKIAISNDMATKTWVTEQTGTLTNLTTTAKTNLVNAVNEVNAKNFVPDMTNQAGKFLTTNGTISSWAVTPTIQTVSLPTASSSNLGTIYQYTGVTTAALTNGYFYQCQISDEALTATQTTGGNSLGTITVNRTLFTEELNNTSSGSYTFVTKGYPTVLYAWTNEEVGDTSLRLTYNRYATSDNLAAGAYAWKIDGAESFAWTSSKIPTSSDTLYSDNQLTTPITSCDIGSVVSESTTDLYWSYNNSVVSLSDYGIYYTGNEVKGDVITVTLTSGYDWFNVPVQTPLPSQTGYSAGVLTTNGSTTSWKNSGSVVPVVETYVSGTSGYRIWADGYCEQWGRSSVSEGTTTVTVPLTKTMANTNYTCQITLFAGNTPFYEYMPGSYLTAWSLTTSSFKYQNYGSSDIQQMWVVKGYLATGQYTASTFSAIKES